MAAVVVVVIFVVVVRDVGVAAVVVGRGGCER